MVGRSYNLSRVKGRLFEDSIIGERVVDNKECDIFSDLLRVITNRNGQRDCTEGVYFSPSETNE